MYIHGWGGLLPFGTKGSSCHVHVKNILRCSLSRWQLTTLESHSHEINYHEQLPRAPDQKMLQHAVPMHRLKVKPCEAGVMKDNVESTVNGG